MASNEKRTEAPLQGTQGPPAERTEARQGAPLERSASPQKGALQQRQVTPFSLMQRMFEDMDRLFGGGFGLHGDILPRSSWPIQEEPFARDLAEATSTWNPAIDVAKRGQRLVVKADLPGVDKKDVRVHLADDAIVIEGERRSESEHTDHGVFHSERSYGSFQRRVAIPAGVDPKSVDARFENGVLEVVVELPQSARRNIEIRSEATPNVIGTGGGGKSSGGSDKPH